MHFLESIARARAAVTNQPTPADLTLSRLTTAPTWPADHASAVIVPVPQPGPVQPRVLPCYPSADSCREGIRLTRGGARLWGLLHQLAVDVGKQREYGAVPHAVAFHVPAVAIALYLGYTERHLARLTDELTEKGLLAGGAHAQNVMGRALWDGTIWKVRTRPDHVPRVMAEEWRHDWRPDFSADYYGKTGARAEMSGLLAQEGHTKQAYAALLVRAAVSDGKKLPLPSSPDNSGKADLHAIAADLPGLVHAHPKDRHAAVTRLASRLTTALNEPERHRQWCRAIYAALNAENQLRPGLQQLALQLTRLAVDLREGAPWKRPGAVVTARLT